MRILRKSKIDELVKFDSNNSEQDIVIGTDEVGRGPVAGPVTAAAVCFPDFDEQTREILKYLDDSKKFSSNHKLREDLAEQIKQCAVYSIEECTVKEIDEINILQATFLAMKKACVSVINQLEKKDSLIIFVDGKKTIPEFNYPQKSIVKGDSKSACIAAASILAKVHRDNFMKEIGQEFPYYCWEKNKGYPTKVHIEAIRTYGECRWHRKKFLRKIKTKQLKLNSKILNL